LKDFRKFFFPESFSVSQQYLKFPAFQTQLAVVPTIAKNTKYHSPNFYDTLKFHRHKTESANSSKAKQKSRAIITDMKKTKTNRTLRNAHALELACIEVCDSCRC